MIAKLSKNVLERVPFNSNYDDVVYINGYHWNQEKEKGLFIFKMEVHENKGGFCVL